MFFSFKSVIFSVTAFFTKGSRFMLSFLIVSRFLSFVVIVGFFFRSSWFLF